MKTVDATPEQEQAKRERFLTLLFVGVPLAVFGSAVGGLALGLLAMALGGFVGSQNPSFHRQYSRIETGMTLAEVESVFGFPGRGLWFFEVPVTVQHPSPSPTASAASTQGGKFVRVVQGDRCNRWDGGTCHVIIGFVNGKVVDKYWWEPSL